MAYSNSSPKTPKDNSFCPMFKQFYFCSEFCILKKFNRTVFKNDNRFSNTSPKIPKYGIFGKKIIFCVCDLNFT